MPAIQEFFDTQPEVINPVVREIIGGAKKFSAADTFNAMYKLEALRKQANRVWDSNRLHGDTNSRDHL